MSTGEMWRAARSDTGLLHLDSAAAGRCSLAVLEAEAEHLGRESVSGGYVAEAEAADRLKALRADLATLLGTDPDGVALVESGTAALDALLASWPLRHGSRVGVAAASWGPTLERLRHREHETVLLDTDSRGVLDLEALQRRLATRPPDLLLVDQVAAHRGLVQPAAQVIEIARAHGVPVWLDAAQGLGHVGVPAGAAAVVATSRKWLCGPRGVGVLAVSAEHRERLTVGPSAKLPDAGPVRRLESEEAHVAGRVGLAVAVREHLALGSEAVAAGLEDVGRRTRAAVAELPGWQVACPDAPAGAITGLEATEGQDVSVVRDRMLREHRILTTACLPWRAPGELRTPLLRVSPHLGLSDDDLERLVRALA